MPIAGEIWSNILESRKPIVANGNAWPAPADESPDDCLVLVTHNQIMWHFPAGNATSHERTVLHRGDGTSGRFRGGLAGMGSNDGDGKGLRMWRLGSPAHLPDELLELDTPTSS